MQYCGNNLKEMLKVNSSFAPTVTIYNIVKVTAFHLELRTVTNIFYTIKVFEKASGLHINYGKSELLGINVSQPDLHL